MVVPHINAVGGVNDAGKEILNFASLSSCLSRRGLSAVGQSQSHDERWLRRTRLRTMQASQSPNE
jgi:hypothetical protein